MKSAILFCSFYEGHHVVKELVLMVGKSPTLQDQNKQGVNSLVLRPEVHTASNHTTKRSLCPLPHLACIALGDSHKGRPGSLVRTGKDTLVLGICFQ